MKGYVTHVITLSKNLNLITLTRVRLYAVVSVTMELAWTGLLSRQEYDVVPWGYLDVYNVKTENKMRLRRRKIIDKENCVRERART